MERRQTVGAARTRILYADDEPQLRMLGKLLLGLSGYDVDTAKDGAEAWIALNEASYNLLITDHDMPSLTGLELVSRVRQAGMRLPIVITSGSLTLHDLASAESDYAAFLPKPFTSDSLLDTVEQALHAGNSNPGRSIGGKIPGLARIARSAQPFPHGGINE